MERFVKGDVVVVSFPFSDLTGFKKRPALVLKVLNRNDIILCQITHKSFENKEEVGIKLTDFQEGKLKLESFIRVTKLFTADISLILYKIGSLKESKFNEVIDKLYLILKEQ